MICARTKRAQRVLKHQNCFKWKFTAFWIKSPIFVKKNRIFPELVGSPCVPVNTYLLFQMMTDISLTLDFNGVVKHLDRKLVLSASYKLNGFDLNSHSTQALLFTKIRHTEVKSTVLVQKFWKLYSVSEFWRENWNNLNIQKCNHILI